MRSRFLIGVLLPELAVKAPGLLVSHVRSIETRKTIGETYSAVRGLYRQYTLIYVVADERDSIRVRTNYRHGEDVYLYRT